MLLTRLSFAAILLILAATCIAATGCTMPDLPTETAERQPSTTVEDVAETASGPEQASAGNSTEEGDTTAVTAVEEDSANTDSSSAPETKVEVATETSDDSVQAEEVAADVDWLSVATQVDYERQAIGNPEAPLTITEYSDFM